MIDHRVVIGRLPSAGLAQARWLGVGTEMHVGRIQPAEPGVARRGLFLNPVLGRGNKLIITSFHPLLCERSSILDFLFADTTIPLIDRGIIGVGGPAMENAARCEFFVEFGEIFFGRPIWEFRFLFGIQVIEIAEEFMKPVNRRQVFVSISQMIFAELSSGVSQRLQKFRYGCILAFDTNSRPRNADFGETGSKAALSRNERRSTCRAALFPIGIRKQHSFIGQSVYIGCPVAHHAMTVTTEILNTDIVTPDNQNVWLFGPFANSRGHELSPSNSRSRH